MPLTDKLKRLPVIRHIRYFYLRRRVYQFAARWNALGIGFGGPNENDLRHLERIWRGEA